MMKKMMPSRNITLLKALAGVNLAGIVVIIIFFNINLLHAFEVGFLSASLVMFASLGAYRRMVLSRVDQGLVTYDDSKDVIDKLEDPYDLYSEEVEQTDEAVDVKEVIKEERSRAKGSGNVSKSLKESKAALSWQRLGAYGVLILGFFYLKETKHLDIWTYIIALGLPTIVIVTLLVKEKETEDTLQ